MIDFDIVASQFDEHRALPTGVARLVRDAVRQRICVATGRPMLEIGSGTGRIGYAFHEVGDAYVGVDLSRGMLDRFGKRMKEGQLAQGDGQSLPFSDGTFLRRRAAGSGPQQHAWYAPGTVRGSPSAAA